MKGALGLIGLVALAGGGFALYSWAFSGSSDAPLTADGILIFDSAKAVEQHYGFIGKTPVPGSYRSIPAIRTS